MLLGVSQLKMSTKIDITAFCNNSKPALNDSAASGEQGNYCMQGHNLESRLNLRKVQHEGTTTTRRTFQQGCCAISVHFLLLALP